MKYASVILDIPTQALDAPYTYAVPEASPEDDFAVEVGCAVLVPFGGRRAVGFVVEIWEDDGEGTGLAGDGGRLAGFSEDLFGIHGIKSIDRAVSKPYFDEEGAACAQFLSRRYIAPLSACVRLFTPPGGVPRIVRTQQGGWRLEEPAVGEVDDRWVVRGPAFDSFKPRGNALKQQAILDALASGDLRVAELTAQLGPVTQAVKSLAEKGAVTVERRRRFRSGFGGGAQTEEKTDPKPSLTEGQTRALETIARALETEAGEVVLIDGVTGSGKTEVYLQAIESVVGKGRTAIVLVPEISLTPQTVARFRGRFGDAVAVLHSRMSQGERYDQWDFIRSGEARVVVGARSALFAPVSNLGLIVIDEEHEGSYKQDSAPRYVSRDVAVWMAKRSGAAVVLGSATPSFESLYASKYDPAWHRVVLPERANRRPMPEIRLVDMAAEFSAGHRSMFSRALIGRLTETLLQGRKAVLLLNQRGFARFVLCRDCGFVPECPSCSTSLTFHERGNLLMCHHCGFRMQTPSVCPECGGPYLKKFGVGTQQVEDRLRELVSSLPSPADGAAIIRMDADTTSAKGSHQKLLEEFAAAEGAVLLGTQMIAKGLDFDDVTLVGVIDADTTLKLPDYRASERTFDLVQQVAGRAGRADLPGEVIVQTYDAANPAVACAARYDRKAFLQAELPKRRMLRYPPYVRMANILVWGSDEAAVRTAATELFEQVATAIRDFGGDGWQILPAVPCTLSKLRQTYRWHILVKCPLEADPSQVLEPLFRTRKANREVNVAVDIDPEDLL